MVLKNVFVLISFLFSFRIFAINLEGFYFSDSFKYAIVDDAFLLKHPGNWLIYSSLGFVNHPFVIANSGSNTNEGVVISNQKLFTFGFNYNLSRTLSVGVESSFISTTLSDDATSVNIAQTAANSQGYSIEEGSNLGDLTFKAKWRFYQNKASKVAFALIPRFTLGTGSEETLTSSESIKWSLMAIGEKLWGRFGFLGGIGYSKTSNAELGDLDYDNAINLQAAISYRLTKDLNFNFELIRNFTVSVNSGADQDSGDYYGTVKWKIDPNYDLYGGLGLAGFNDVDEENYTLFAGVKIHPAKEEKKKVVKVNRKLSRVNDQYVQAGSKMRTIDVNLAATGSDTDARGNRVTYSCSFDREVDDQVLGGNTCTSLRNFSFNQNSGISEWTIPEDASGSYEFQIDGFLEGNLFDSEVFVVTVATREAEKKLGTLFKADRVYFDNSSTIIKGSETKKLDEVADYLVTNENNVSKVIVEGYASKVGKSLYNRQLSNGRSTNVMKYLVDKGVNPELLQTVAYGDDYLNEDPEHWQNRRVEFRIYNKK